MRKRMLSFILFAWVSALVSACVTKATDDELQDMCDNLVKLRGEIKKPSSATFESDISMKFEKKTQMLKASQESEQRRLNDEMKKKLEAVTDEAEKANIMAEYEEKIAAVKADLAPEIASLNAKKSEEIESEKRKAEEGEAAWRLAVEACLNDAKRDAVSQKVAQCRIQADSTDKYWNICR